MTMVLAQTARSTPLAKRTWRRLHWLRISWLVAALLLNIAAGALLCFAIGWVS